MSVKWSFIPHFYFCSLSQSLFHKFSSPSRCSPFLPSQPWFFTYPQPCLSSPILFSLSFVIPHFDVLHIFSLQLFLSSHLSYFACLYWLSISNYLTFYKCTLNISYISSPLPQSSSRYFDSLLYNSKMSISTGLKFL